MLPHRSARVPFSLVLGFAGHPLPQLITSAERLAKASLAALRANRKPNSSSSIRKAAS